MHKEEIIYTMSQLKKENEEGLSIIFYLQNVYPDEWQNFLERTKMDENEAWEKDRGMELRLWASCRGQTLARTVRGMMYYVRALELQAFFDLASQVGECGGGCFGRRVIRTQGLGRCLSKVRRSFWLLVVCF